MEQAFIFAKVWNNGVLLAELDVLFNKYNINNVKAHAIVEKAFYAYLAGSSDSSIYYKWAAEQIFLLIPSLTAN